MGSDDVIGVIVINFGEPATPTREAVLPFLERIFFRNMGLEDAEGDAARIRARTLAERRAPGLIEEYEAIGGSPLNAQAIEQAAALGDELERRGVSARIYPAFQFMGPDLGEAVDQAVADGVTTLVALPVYPLCGPSTTVASLDDVRAHLEGNERVDWVGLAGWHAHPKFVRVRADNIRRFAEQDGVDLAAKDVVLYFSAHGTPISYLERGSRYDRYVEEHARQVAEAVGARRWVVGFQNHTNRGLPWTGPDNEALIETLSETHLVVDAISFVHEQSETLSELDGELRAFAESCGKTFHRVPVPTSAPGLIDVLAGLVEEAVTDSFRAPSLFACRCSPGAICTNGDRDLPPSPYGPTGSA